jgi:hypothetical protein
VSSSSTNDGPRATCYECCLGTFDETS